MSDLTHDGNLIEACLWFLFALVLAIKGVTAAHPRRRIFALLALGFLAFGISDLIEAQTGAWWRPPWLLVLKAACIVTFVIGFIAYYRTK